MPYVTFFRGTTEPWEQEAIASGELLSYRQYVALNGDKRKQLAKRGGWKAKAFSELTPLEIQQEVVKRVGVETALGTVNSYSHFVPLGTHPGISLNFGHGNCFVFVVECVLINATTAHQIELALTRAKDHLAAGSVPVFQGGSSEYLAYTGTLVDLPQVFSARKKPEKYADTYSSRSIELLSKSRKLPVYDGK